MPNFHAVRVCAVGTENEMQNMLGNMLKNVGLKSQDVPNSIYRKIDRIKYYAKTELDDFQYNLVMINPKTQSGFVTESSSLTVQKHKNGLFTALFEHEEAWRFDYNNFLALHIQSQNIPMFAIHADESCDCGRGSVDITDGTAEEDFDDMDAAYMLLQILKYDIDGVKKQYKEFGKYTKSQGDKETWGYCLEEMSYHLEHAIKNEHHSEAEMAIMNLDELHDEIFQTAQIELWGGESAKKYLKTFQGLLVKNGELIEHK